jgi:hypothetical protein
MGSKKSKVSVETETKHVKIVPRLDHYLSFRNQVKEIVREFNSNVILLQFSQHWNRILTLHWPLRSDVYREFTCPPSILDSLYIEPPHFLCAIFLMIHYGIKTPEDIFSLYLLGYTVGIHTKELLFIIELYGVPKDSAYNIVQEICKDFE